MSHFPRPRQEKRKRRKAAPIEEKGASGKTIREEVMAGAVLFTKEVAVRGRRAKTSCETRGRRAPRKNRTAVVEVRAARVMVRAPKSDRPLGARLGR